MTEISSDLHLFKLTAFRSWLPDVLINKINHVEIRYSQSDVSEGLCTEYN